MGGRGACDLQDHIIGGGRGPSDPEPYIPTPSQNMLAGIRSQIQAAKTHPGFPDPLALGTLEAHIAELGVGCYVVDHDGVTNMLVLR